MLDFRNRNDERKCVGCGNCKMHLALAILVLFAIPGRAAEGKPAVREFLPRAIKLGTDTELTVVGSFPKWPVDFWVDREGLEFRAGAKGKITVKTSKRTLPGVYLVRLRDDTGVSEPVPLIVDSIATTIEKEPNGLSSQANPLESSANVSGVLAKSGDVDCFSIQCKKGQALFAGMRANPLLGTTMDGVIQICDSRGFVLDQNDDRKGIDPSISVPIPNDGVYIVRVFAFPATPNSTVRFAGGADYRYLLTISNGPVVQLTYPMTDKLDSDAYRPIGTGIPNDLQVFRGELNSDQVLFYSRGVAGFFEMDKSSSASKAIVEPEGIPDDGIELPFDFTGKVSVPRQMDWLPFRCKKSRKIRFSIEARRFGLELDPSAAVFDSKGKQLFAKDDNSKTDPDLNFEFSPRADGLYYLRIKDAADAGGESYIYRCRAEYAEPEFRLSVKNSSYEIAANKTLELEVSIDRRYGHNKPIEIGLTGLPDNVKVDPVTSKAKEKSEKSVKLIINAKEPFQSVVQVVGKSDGQERSAKNTLSSGKVLRDFWITCPKSEKTKK